MLRLSLLNLSSLRYLRSFSHYLSQGGVLLEVKALVALPSQRHRLPEDQVRL